MAVVKAPTHTGYGTLVQGVPEPVQRLVVELVPADITGWDTTDITLLGSPGEGAAYEVLGIRLKVDVGATAYANAGASDTMQVNDEDGNLLMSINAGWIDIAANTSQTRVITNNSSGQRLYPNKGMEIAGSSITGGSGTATATIDYRVIKV